MSSERHRHKFKKGDWRSSATVPIFAPCATHLDIKNGKLRGATVSEVFKCCNERCRPKFEYCTSMCEKHLDAIYAHDIASTKVTTNELMKRCKSNCRTIGNLCTQVCRALSPGFNLDNHYHNCAIENGCKPGLGQLPDKSCVEKKKDVIFNCCRSNCLPNSVTNCQDLCLTLQDTVLNPEKLGIPQDMYAEVRDVEKKDSEDVSTSTTSPVLKSSQNEQPKSTNLYLLTALIIGLTIALLIIGFIWWRRYRKNK